VRPRADTDTRRAARAHQHMALSMHPHHYRDLIVRAVLGNTSAVAAHPERLDQLAAAMADAERAREILGAKGYGASGMSASATAAQVPNASAT
jgi:hypothetical protein